MRLATVPIDDVHARPQARRHFDSAAIERLASSIREVGLQQPLLCRRCDGALVLVDGERRLRACTLLGMTHVPVLIDEEGSGTSSDNETRKHDNAHPNTHGHHQARALVCNLQREDLLPMERARGVRELMDSAGMSAQRAAELLGTSPATVSRWLALLSLPAPIQAMVDQGSVPADAAYALARIEDPTQQAAKAQQIADGALTRDALVRSMKRKRAPKSSKASNALGRAGRLVLPIDSGRSLTISGPDLTIDAAIQWLEALLSRARKAKAQGLSLATLARAMRDQTQRS